MYKSILEVYLIIVRLNQRERKKRVNVFSLALESYNNDFADIIKVIKFDMIKLNKNVLMEMNNVKHIICVYIITLIDDIK